MAATCVTGVAEDGQQVPLRSPVLPETDHREDSDQLEADTRRSKTCRTRCSPAFDHADGHVITLRGAVDIAEERRSIELRVLGVRGVSEVKNHITTMGVDSHIPSDID